jgi:hypothetical protein
MIGEIPGDLREQAKNKQADSNHEQQPQAMVEIRISDSGARGQDGTPWESSQSGRD